MPLVRRVPSIYSWVASATFAAEAVFAIVHRATGAEYPGFAHVHNVVIDLGLAAIWLIAAFVALLRRPTGALAFLLAGAATSFLHFLLFTIASTARSPSIVGLPFLAAALVQFIYTAHAFPEFTRAHERRHVEDRGKPSPWRLVSRRAF